PHAHVRGRTIEWPAGMQYLHADFGCGPGPARGGGDDRARGFSRYAAVALLLAVPPVPAHAAFDSENPAPSESLPDEAIRKVIADYGKAIETKDLDLFRTVKPNLSEEEERRARTAFGTVKSQVVKITVNSVDVQ